MPPLAVAVAVLLSHGVSGAWLKLPADARAASPPARFGHGAVYAAGALVISHGYKLDKPTGAQGVEGRNVAASVPDWRDDTWLLHGDADWSRSSPCSGSMGAATGVPEARFGQSLTRIGRSVYLFGGDDGGHAMGRGYVRSLRNDVWRLARCRGAGDNMARNSWAQLGTPVDAPEPLPRSLHACVTVLMPTKGGAALREAALCYGGLAYDDSAEQDGGDSADGAGAHGHSGHGAAAASGGGLVDSGEIWLMTANSQRVDMVDWTRLSVGGTPADAVDHMAEARAGRAPLPRHGHAMTYHSRPVAVGSGAQVAMEHAVVLYGGTALDCGSRGSPAYGTLERHEYVTYDRPGAPAHSHKDTGAHGRRAAAATGPGSGGGDDSGFSSLFGAPAHGPGRPGGDDPVSCALGDTWRLVWHVPVRTRDSDNHVVGGDSDGRSFGFQRPAVNNSAPLAVPSGLRWQKVTFAANGASGGEPAGAGSPDAAANTANVVTTALGGSGGGSDPYHAPHNGAAVEQFNSRFKNTLQSWLTLSQLGSLASVAGVGSGGAGAGLRHPSPRGHAAMSHAHSGLLLFGGALCAPGCTDVFDDTWLLRMAPTAVLTPESVNAHAVAAKDLGYAWRRQRPHPILVTVNIDGAAAPLAAAAGGAYNGVESDGAGLARAAPLPFTCGLIATAGASIDGPELRLDVELPHKRYRHTLTSHSPDGVSTDAPPVLFGGESFFPSAYFSDAWVWVEPEDLDACASEGVVVDMVEITDAAELRAAAAGGDRGLLNGPGGPSGVRRGARGSGGGGSFLDRWLRPKGRNGSGSQAKQPTITASFVAIVCALVFAFIAGPLQCCIACFKQPSRKRRVFGSDLVISSATRPAALARTRSTGDYSGSDNETELEYRGGAYSGMHGVVNRGGGAAVHHPPQRQQQHQQQSAYRLHAPLQPSATYHHASYEPASGYVSGYSTAHTLYNQHQQLPQHPQQHVGHHAAAQHHHHHHGASLHAATARYVGGPLTGASFMQQTQSPAGSYRHQHASAAPSEQGTPPRPTGHPSQHHYTSSGLGSPPRAPRGDPPIHYGSSASVADGGTVGAYTQRSSATSTWFDGGTLQLGRGTGRAI